MSGAGAAGWAMTLLGARQSPQEGAGILQVSRTPPSQAGYPCPSPQQGKVESAAGETRKVSAVSQCSPEGVANMQHSGVPTNSRSTGPAWARPPGHCHLLGSLSHGLAP